MVADAGYANVKSEDGGQGYQGGTVQERIRASAVLGAHPKQRITRR